MRIISAPASARARAMWAPMPRVPPVTTAVRPSREKRAGSEGAMIGIGECRYSTQFYVCNLQLLADRYLRGRRRGVLAHPRPRTSMAEQGANGKVRSDNHFQSRR
jgi:hypothetical protein